MRISTFYQFQKQTDIINKQYADMSKLYAQTNGKKIQSSSEDPVLANQIKSTQTYMQNINNYYNNGVLAQNRSRLFSTSMQNVTGVLTDVTTLMTKAQGGTLSERDSESIAEQLQGDLSMLLGYANTQDADGNYIYSGFNTNTTPYVQVNGSYQYQGGYTSAAIDIGPNSNVIYYESGFNVFSNIFTGNGTFTITADSNNTGTASTSPGNVVDSTAYVADTYTLSFATNSSNQLVYSITGASSGQVIPPLPGTIPDDAPVYVPNAGITFNGISFSVEGAPKAGDNFVIQPSTQENIFNSVQDFIDLLQNPPANVGLYNQQLSQLSATFSQASTHLTTYLSQVGTRSQQVDNQVKNNDDVLNNSKIALSGLQDSDIVAVYSALAQKSVALQATFAGYAQLQQTLMDLLKL